MRIEKTLQLEAIELLKSLIRTSSISKNEFESADIIESFFAKKKIKISRENNNVWVFSKSHVENAPTILLNSHHDTVKPVLSWSRDPFEPSVENDKLYGLGSNDAGASLVSLAVVFLHYYYIKEKPFNLIFIASAEEEISGKLGIESAIPKLGNIDLGIVGEPTQMQMAVAEKGLMVIDGLASGQTGHAARDEGVNAIYTAINDIEMLKNYRFEKTSELLGDVKISITQIDGGSQHNVVPDQCNFVIDVRTTELYSNQEVFDVLQKLTKSNLVARSFRLNSSRTPFRHSIIDIGRSIGLSSFGSATLSDQALMPFPTIKIGPGNSKRSHTANEYIKLEELKNGIDIYIQLLDKMISLYEKK